MLKWDGLGMNYGHVWNAYTSANADTDLALLKSKGFTKIRIMYPLLTDTTYVNQCKEMVTKALAQGFYVIWGTCCQAPFTQAQWNTFKANVPTLAAWAQSLNNPNFEFAIGNEEDADYKHDEVAIATVRTDLLALATAVQAVYTVGPVSYQAGADSASVISAWATLGKGNLDKIGFNVYGNGQYTFGNFCSWVQYIQDSFGSAAYISEWNDGWGYLSTEDELWYAKDVVKRLRFLKHIGISSAYFFNYNHEAGNTGGMLDGEWNLLSEDRTTTRDAFTALCDEQYLVNRLSIKDFGTALKFKGPEIVYLFADGFESGDLTKWSSATTDGTNLSVTAEAAINGTYGLSVLINDTNAIFVRDESPGSEKRYRCRFYLDPNGISMANNSVITILSGDGFSIYLKYTSSVYKIYVQDNTDGAWTGLTGEYTISDAPHRIEVDWKASTAPEANDGFISLWIDGSLQETLTGIDSDTEQMYGIQLGASWMSSTPSGTLYFDDFASNNDGSEIGLYVAPVLTKLTVPVAPSTSGFCIALWMKTDKIPPSTWNRIFSFETGNNGARAYLNGGTVGMDFEIGNGSSFAQSAWNPNGGFGGDLRWHHWVFMYQGTTAYVYLDGELYSYNTAMGSMVTAAGQTLTFGQNSGSGNEITALMDEIVLHNTNTAWTAQQIADLYYKGKLPAGSQVYYKLDEGSGTSATDTSGNSNTGTIAGSTYSADIVTKPRTSAGLQ